jgi:4-hydroxythreonine-4-phosphate dehydrogenase
MMVRVGVTMGDPNGIGPEVTTKALQEFAGKAQFIAYAPDGFYPTVKGLTYVPPSGDNHPLSAIERSAKDLKDGVIDAVVTAPVNKSVFEGTFPGHTELYEARLNSEEVAMMMYGDRLKTVPVTTHIALRDVADSLSVDLYVRRALTVDRFLRENVGLERPRIALAGLNPHAGDGGLFGDEEATILEPAVRALRDRGIEIEGPISPDTVFHHAVNGHYDAVLCAYHDQALIPFKLLHFSDGVNVTLGLGAIRTSPDHGPAIDIAGQGIADPSSMIEAMRLAITLGSKNVDNV